MQLYKWVRYSFFFLWNNLLSRQTDRQWSSFEINENGSFLQNDWSFFCRIIYSILANKPLKDFWSSSQSWQLLAPWVFKFWEGSFMELVFLPIRWTEHQLICIFVHHHISRHRRQIFALKDLLVRRWRLQLHRLNVSETSCLSPCWFTESTATRLSRLGNIFIIEKFCL